jgi:hypothetical protein
MVSSLLSVVVNNFHLFRPGISSDKTDAVLVVDPDAVLAVTIATQRFKTIAGWNPQFVEGW